MSNQPAPSSPEKPSRPEAGKPNLPLTGWATGSVPTPVVDTLSNEDLEALNGLLPWSCFTVDGHGRRFGDAAWVGKRDKPQGIPDLRIVAMDQAFTLAGKHVLEIGCFEGVHTIALCQRAALVTAIDSRIENVVKTVVRCAMFAQRPEVAVCDVESEPDLRRLPAVDLVHHVGVLYHLKDPVAHLQQLAKGVRQGMLLDTHVAPPTGATQTYTSGGRSFRYYRHKEGGKAEVFSGMYDHAKWLLLDDLVAVLKSVGFARVEQIELADQRNGPRVRLHAHRV